jgi:hypothetical protein
MKTKAPFALAFLAFLVFLACSKTSTIVGTVTDSGTGMPVPGIKIQISAKKIVNVGSKAVDQDEAVTDEKGSYLVEVSGTKSNVDFVFMGARVDNRYVEPAYRLFDIGDCPNGDYILNPYDAWLHLSIQNTNGLSNTFYYGVTGSMYEGRRYVGPFGSGPFSILPNTSIEHVLRVPGGGYVQIIWDNNKLTSSGIPHLDSVYCARNDTTHYVLQY